MYRTNGKDGFRMVMAAAAFLLVLGALQSVWAGGHWFSGDFVADGKPYTQQRAWAGAALPSGPALFDVVINLDTVPVGDNDPATVDERTPYEQIIQYFADGVYEESNARHAIRNVRIYTKGKYAANCDILWKSEQDIPNSDPAGRGQLGKSIHMFSHMPGSSDSDFDFLANREAGGYCLAREWGHYFYGLYDEYKAASPADDALIDRAHSTDDPVPFSIMNSQWGAVGGNYEWLNFSTSTRFDYTNNNAQFRVYEAAAWQTLIRPVSGDPRDGNRSTLGTRTYYPDLAGAAPTTDTSIINLPATAARAALKISWMSDNITYQVVIDHSGSMEGEKLDNAKTAAKMLVDLVDANTTNMGIIMFDDTVQVLAPPTALSVPGNKDLLKSRIDSIVSGNNTAILDAAEVALNGLLRLSSTDDSKAVFLLTDGLSNSDTVDRDTVVSGYQAAQIPLFTFAYGDDADQAWLAALAADTRGQFFYSPISLGAITAALTAANRVVSANSGLANGTVTGLPAQPQCVALTVDSTLKDLSVVVTYPGAIGDAEIHLVSPGGALVTSATLSQSSVEAMAYFHVDSPAIGTWLLVMTNNSQASLDFKYQADALPAGVVSYSLSVQSTQGSSITYPDPVVLLAVVAKQLPISGSVITGYAVAPSGAIVPIVFRDDGVAPDVLANDGKYSAIFDYAENGAYEIVVNADNTENRAALTCNGLLLTTGPDGPIGPPADVPVGEAFARSTRLQLMVSGVAPDDCSSEPGDWNNGQIVANNVDRNGKIDHDGDVDTFRISVPDTSHPVVVRVTNAALGMSPWLAVVASDGVTTLTRGTVATDGLARGYVALRVARPTNPLYAVVGNCARGTGLYSVSAGPQIGHEINISLLRVDRWSLKPGKPSKDTMTLSGEFISRPGTLALDKDGVVFSFNEGAVEEIFAPAGFADVGKGHFIFKSATASGSFLTNVGGSSRCKYTVRMSGDYKSLRGIRQMDVDLATGTFDDDTLLGVSLKGNNGAQGSYFSATKDTYLSPELFVDSYQMSVISDGPANDSLRLAVRFPGAPLYDYRSDTLQVNLRFAQIAVAPADWQVDSSGTALAAVLPGALGPGSQVTVKCVPQKNTLSIQASKADLSNSTEFGLVGLSYAGYRMADSLTLSDKYTWTSDRYAY